MNAWAVDQRADNIRFIPDGNGEFSNKMGMLVDRQEMDFGQRIWRYSMRVRGGVIEKMFIEPDKLDDSFEVSDADTMLSYINAAAEQPKRVALFFKLGCPYCDRSKDNAAR